MPASAEVFTFSLLLMLLSLMLLLQLLLFISALSELFEEEAVWSNKKEAANALSLQSTAGSLSSSSPCNVIVVTKQPYVVVSNRISSCRVVLDVGW